MLLSDLLGAFMEVYVVLPTVLGLICVRKPGIKWSSLQLRHIEVFRHDAGNKTIGGFHALWSYSWALITNPFQRWWRFLYNDPDNTNCSSGVTVSLVIMLQWTLMPKRKKLIREFHTAYLRTRTEETPRHKLCWPVIKDGGHTGARALRTSGQRGNDWGIYWPPCMECLYQPQNSVRWEHFAIAWNEGKKGERKSLQCFFLAVFSGRNDG